jgi:protein phosphatase
MYPAAAQGSDQDTTIELRLPREAQTQQSLTSDPRAYGAELGQLEAANASPKAERKTKRRRRGKRLMITSAVLTVVLGLVLMGGWFATRAIYFIGTDPSSANAVAIYQGLPYELPGGIKLYQRYVSSGVTLAQVPQNRIETVTNHKLRTLKDAESLLYAIERGELVAGSEPPDQRPARKKR